MRKRHRPPVSGSGWPLKGMEAAVVSLGRWVPLSLRLVRLVSLQCRNLRFEIGWDVDGNQQVGTRFLSLRNSWLEEPTGRSSPTPLCTHSLEKSRVATNRD